MPAAKKNKKTPYKKKADSSKFKYQTFFVLMPNCNIFYKVQITKG